MAVRLAESHCRPGDCLFLVDRSGSRIVVADRRQWAITCGHTGQFVRPARSAWMEGRERSDLWSPRLS